MWILDINAPCGTREIVDVDYEDITDTKQQNNGNDQND